MHEQGSSVVRCPLSARPGIPRWCNYTVCYRSACEYLRRINEQQEKEAKERKNQ